MTLITHKHMRSLGYCNRGGRLLCKRYGLNWSTLRTQGIDSEKLKEITGNDAHVNKLVLYAKSLENVHTPATDNKSDTVDKDK